MKKYSFIVIWLMLLAPLACGAQTYKQLWNEVAEFKKKDLPRSVISSTDKIILKAETENNVSQMLAAYITRSEYRVRLDGDNKKIEKKALLHWADTEKNVVVKSILNSIAADMMSREQESDVDEILRRIGLSIQPVDALSSMLATDFIPVTVISDFSRKYFADNLYDLIVREAIRTLNSNWYLRRDSKVQQYILSLYDKLEEFHAGHRQALMFTREAKLLYLSSYWVADKYRLDSDKLINALQVLADEYADLDVCADVYIKLALRYNAQGNPSKAMQILQSAKATYRRTEFSNKIEQNIQYLLTPYLTVSIDPLMPLNAVTMNVVHRNLTSFELAVFRLQLTPAQVLSMDDYHLGESTVQKYGKKVGNRKFALPSTDDLKNKNTQIEYQLPVPGIYLFRFTANGNEAPVYRLACVSGNNSLTFIADKEKMELIAIDKVSGHPLPGAEFVFFKFKGKAYAEVERIKSNQQGSITLNREDYDKMYFNVVTPSDSFMPLQRIYSSFLFQSREARREQVIDHLFTDRSIYRPGQKLYVSGVRFVQTGDSTKVLPNEKVTLELRDSHFRTVAEKHLTTDEFGTYSAEFILPETVLPGTFSIRTDKAHSRIKVEEYKRPTFNVSFIPYREAYHFGDSINVEGMAQMFSGAPVQAAKVEYKLRRWQAWFWRFDYRGRTVLKTGETTVGADGKFRLGFTLQEPDQVDDFHPGYYEYALEAKVTARNGETHISTMRFPVGRQSIGLQVVGLNGNVVREQQKEIQLQALNLDRQKVDVSVGYNIYKVDGKGKKAGLMLHGTASSNTSFLPSDIYALPSGKYIIELKAADDRQRECKAESEFTLFSLNDKKVPYATTAWFYHGGEVFVGDRPVTLYAGTSEKNVYLMVDIYTNKGRIKSERIYLNNEIRKFTFDYHKEYGDGLEVNFSIVRNGKLYTDDTFIRLSEPDKHLNLSWKTFRNKLRPGTQEEWVLKITDKDGHPAKANLLAMMYDAALDDIYVRSQNHSLSFVRRWIGGNAHYNNGDHSINIESRFPHVGKDNGLDLLSADLYSHLLQIKAARRRYSRNGIVALNRPAYSMSANNSESQDVVFEEEVVEKSVEESQQSADLSEQNGDSFAVLRENFNETAFFYPVLRTDSAGEVSMSFTLPDALTEWNFTAYAHTQNMDNGVINERIKASKPFMVQPNMPRFVRVGDKSVIAVSLINMSDSTLTGGVKMTLVDPLTDKVVHASSLPYTVGGKMTEAVDFTYRADGQYDILVCRIEAQGTGFSDGEQRYLPVLTDKEVITETLPVQLNGPGTVRLPLNHLFNGGSATATEHHLTVELTANPDWYAVQALPYMAVPSSENALSWAVAFYANAMSMHIVNANPGIRKAFDMWRQQGGKEAFVSQLDKNKDLKHIILEESPWLADAASEAEQKRHIALLFDLNTMAYRQNMVQNRLSELQQSDGSWSWYRGMSGNLFITTQIVEYMARLHSMGITMDVQMERMYFKALSYLKNAVRKEYERKKEAKSHNLHFAVSETTLKYLYICAIDKAALNVANQKVNSALVQSMLGHSADYTIYGKAVMAIVMQAHGYRDEAMSLLQSLREYTVYTKEMGRYYDGHNAYYSFNDTRIPTQVAAMEAISRIDSNESELADMKQWLLKQKQVQMWRTSVASADAVHAFLCIGGTGMSVNGKMKAKIGAQVIVTPDDALGYTRQSVNNVKARSVTFTKTGKGLGWGAVYAQCKDNMSNIKSYNSKGLSIERTYWKDGKPLLHGTGLSMGDEVTVKLQVEVDRDMDFVQIKDSRAACMEPVSQLSGYRWKNGLGYFAVSRDASTQFFIDRIRKGSYTIEYTVLIDRLGEYQPGTASIQCAYAPEFAAHSAAESLLKVE